MPYRSLQHDLYIIGQYAMLATDSGLLMYIVRQQHKFQRDNAGYLLRGPKGPCTQIVYTLALK